MAASPPPATATPVRDFALRHYWPVLLAMTVGALSIALVVVWAAYTFEKAKLMQETHAAAVQAVETTADPSARNQARDTTPPQVAISSEPETPVDGRQPDPTPSSAADMLPPPAHVTLVPAPIAAVTEDTPEGPLPRIAEDGKRPWQVYSRPVPGIAGARVAIVLAGLGPSKLQTSGVVGVLPPDVTLAFDAQSPTLGAWLYRARQMGYETLITLPLEPFDYPRNDPGPSTLLTNLSGDENLSRLHIAMKRGSGYVGVTTLTGGRFITVPESVRPVLEDLSRRGLLYFDARSTPRSVATELAREMKMPFAVATLRLDTELVAEAIDSSLTQLVQKALQSGKAIGVASANPLVVERLNRWAATLREQGVRLVPLSAVVE